MYDINDIEEAALRVLADPDAPGNHTNCVHFDYGFPVCLVGWILEDLGFTEEDTENGLHYPVAVASALRLTAVADRMTEDAIELLVLMQCDADNPDVTWAEAVRHRLGLELL